MSQAADGRCAHIWDYNPHFGWYCERCTVAAESVAEAGGEPSPQPRLTSSLSSRVRRLLQPVWTLLHR